MPSTPLSADQLASIPVQCPACSAAARRIFASPTAFTYRFYAPHTGGARHPGACPRCGRSFATAPDPSFSDRRRRAAGEFLNIVIDQWEQQAEPDPCPFVRAQYDTARRLIRYFASPWDDGDALRRECVRDARSVLWAAGVYALTAELAKRLGQPYDPQTGRIDTDLTASVSASDHAPDTSAPDSAAAAPALPASVAVALAAVRAQTQSPDAVAQLDALEAAIRDTQRV